MRSVFRFWIASLLVLFSYFYSLPSLADNQTEVDVPVLVYHRLGPTVADSMTITTSSFAAQLKWLQDNHYQVIPLKTLVDYLQGNGAPPPAKSVVITADDGHKSVYTDMLPLVRQYHIPVTLFIYPSAISNASYAMTWQQLQEIQQTGLFDIQGHTYWHPNFDREKKKQSPEEYAKFVDVQLSKSKATLDKKLNIHVTMLAWPFGIYNDELEAAAAKAGYTAAFTIDGRPANKTHKMLAQPRYMIVNSNSDIKHFANIVAGQVVAKGIE
jgi:peptidoglycan/xylan/chitin deacetylase (PgdA/CDA1 family)